MLPFSEPAMIDLNDTISVCVKRKNVEAVDIVSFELVALDGADLPPVVPGAHIDIHIPGGYVRQYSLCNASNDTERYVVAILRDAHSRGGSIAMHDNVMDGDILQISKPRNHFPLHAEAGNHLLFAGGIGVTPLICMSDQLHRENRPFSLHYCTRSKDRMAFHKAIMNSAWADKAHYHFDDGAIDQKLDVAAVLGAASRDTHLYVCGPQGFMDSVLNTARETGWEEDRLHYEYFKHAVTQNNDDTTFEVEIASTGTVLIVPPGKSVAAVLNEHGFNISMSCEQGVCGTCVTRVLSGTPDHRDTFLLSDEREANDQMTPCCSRSKSSRLILDL
ncbi:PDR/VanB family oxidoreductase [Burkholderia anthina]|uniref:PDR/VanB family oxidoreductase n=1 Tax=Burkholderia anthina TaxID=179879 RepID=UPI0021BBBD00|nr:PDR/VanB family oxidoreductase [Burkholderia anthina]